MDSHSTYANKGNILDFTFRQHTIYSIVLLKQIAAEVGIREVGFIDSDT